MNNIDDLFQQLLTALQVSEKRHRTVRDSASDNSDWNTYDAEGELISSIIKWRRSLEPLRVEIVASDAVDEIDIPSLPTPLTDSHKLNTDADLTVATLENEEDIKVGKYIKAKLHELSESGFVFTQKEIKQMCDLDWSRQTFTYDRFLPFAQIADAEKNVSEQAKDKNGYNRYWNQVFQFGDAPLLIISQWYAKDKESFDNWYNGLPRVLPVATPDTLIFSKTVDWSTLNYGVSIPVASWDSFFNALGQTVNERDSCNITIDIKDSATAPFRVTVIHTVSGATNSVQIRYVQTSEIAEELRRIFKITFDYCNHERNLNGENSRVLIPADLAECIDIYSTGVPNTLRFVCSPRITAETDDADVTDTELESANTKTKPTKIILLGKAYPIGAWNEMFVKVCEVMLLHQPYTMAAMDKDKEFNTEQRIHFSYIQSEIKFRGKRLSNGLWIETNENSEWTLNACRRLLEKCGFSPDELQVETLEVI